MEGLILTIHIVVCLLLVIVVLLQSGKSADLAGAFGGAGSQSTFGPRGAATFLSKMTTTLAILFMVTSLSLWIIAANKADATTVIKDEPKQEEQAGKTEGDKAVETDTQAPKADEATTPAEVKDGEKAGTVETTTSEEKKDETKPAETEKESTSSDTENK